MTEPPVVLIVDDDASLREMAAALLQLEGYQAEPLRAEAALGWLETAWPAALVVDLRMWPMDGVTLLEEIKRRHGRVPPTVVVTAYMLEGQTRLLTERAAALGAVSVLTKPFTMAELTGAVAAAAIAQGAGSDGARPGD